MFHVTIKCFNDAFTAGALPHELARILRKLADSVEGNLGDTDEGGKIMDHNGNSVGQWSYEKH